MAPEIVTLRDATTGSSARVLVGFGFNCFEFKAMPGGREVDVLWAEEGFETGTKKPSGSGIPILFPFPGRIAGTTLRYQGREYQLEVGDNLGNAIHGFVHKRPWRVLEKSEQHVTGEFHAAVDLPNARDAWPGDFRIRLTYRLEGTALSIDAMLENPGNTPLPMGFGVHPYFRVPLATQGKRNDGTAAQCIVQAPVTEYWELVNMIATGRKLPASGRGDLASGMKFGETQFDDVFAGLQSEHNWHRASIADPTNGHRLTIEFDQAFRECVIYNPPHREAICIEPYTCVPGAIELAERGIDAGLRVMEAGEAIAARVRVSVDG